MIDIAMTTHNRGRISEVSIRQIKTRTITQHRLIVLDNGSEDDTPQRLNRLYDEGLIDKLVLHPENNGIHWAKNELMHYIESDWFISTDDDIVPQAVKMDEDGKGRDWLNRLLLLKGRHPEYGAISCRPHVFIGAGNLFADPETPEILERSHCGSVLRLMNTSLVRELGGWKDEIAPKRNNEEWYICEKIRKAGYKVGIARDIHCIHLFGEHDLGEDPWGYPLGSDNKARGHRDIWPPVNHSDWKRLGINWETCRAERLD